MKKIFFTVLFLPLVIFAKSYLVSDVPLPKIYVQNLDPYMCDEECLQELIDHDMILSFLAYADQQLPNPEQEQIRAMHVSILNLDSNIQNEQSEQFKIQTQTLKIAMLIPYKYIGKYATSTTNAVFAYLMAKNNPFELKTYKIASEAKNDIQQALLQIKNDGFHYVIAPMTQNGVNAVSQINHDMIIYFPTVNKKDVDTNSPSLYFGGIDYKTQSDLLLQKADAPLVIFYDNSSISEKLAQYEEAKFKFSSENTGQSKRVYKYSIPKLNSNLETYFKENSRIQGGSFFINTPIVKSAMIMAQLTLYDVQPKVILSTQINYDPLLLSMTQMEDRKNMIVANSITENNNVLIETNSLLGNDIVYDWINYTTTIGMDYFHSLITQEARDYKIPLQNNQMLYPVELLEPSLSKFVSHESNFEER